MTTPKALSSEELLDLFRSRGMQVDDRDIDKINHINYYKLKEFAHPLSTHNKINGVVQISYEGVSFQDVLRRYYQDKNLRIYLIHAIEKVEVSIKTTLSHEMGLRYGAFGYLEYSKWVHREKYTRFQIEGKQYNLKKNILKSVSQNKSAEFVKPENINADGFPTIWLAIEAMSFGDMKIMLDMMSDSLLRSIAAVYQAEPEEFLSWVKCLHFIRNICAHNSNLIDVKLKTKPKFRKDWIPYLYFIKSKKNGMQTPTNRLAAVICIVVYIVKRINPKYKWGNIQRSIQSLCNNSEQMAQLLGFRTLDDAQKITEKIK